MIEFIGPLYNLLQQFTNHYLTHCHLLPTGHSTGTILTSKWTPLYSAVLLQFWSELRLIVPSYNSSARTPRKTPPSVVKNACLLVRYLAVDVLLRAYASGICLPSCCLAMGICITLLSSFVRFAIHCETWRAVSLQSGLRCWKFKKGAKGNGVKFYRSFSFRLLQLHGWRSD
jgi:hypothetical protein